MTDSTQMYPAEGSSLPTVITHSVNGLGIFVVADQVEAPKLNALEWSNENEVLTIQCHLGDINVPLSGTARLLLLEKGGLLALTTPTGKPWFTAEIEAMVPDSARVGDFNL